MLCLIIFGILNYQSKCFLGDSGCYVLVTYTSFLTIYAYNINLDSFYSYLNIESIFLLFMIPGLDMIRLFITRIFKKKNPFSPDKDGHEDELIISYNIPYSYSKLYVDIYSINGILMKSLSEGVVVPSNGFIQWDGYDNSGRKCKLGIYILKFEAVDSYTNSTFKKCIF